MNLTNIIYKIKLLIIRVENSVFEKQTDNYLILSLNFLSSVWTK